MLTIHQVAKSMDRRKGRGGFPFEIVYATADKSRGTAGDIRKLRGHLPKPMGTFRLTRDRADGVPPTVDVQPIGLAGRVRVHLDLILFFNHLPVE